MFDFRYHVASLAAVFLALIVGIVVGVGLSGQGILEEGDRALYNERIEDLQAELDRLGSELEARRAAQTFVEEAHGAVLANRLAGKRVAVVFLGAADRDGLRSGLLETIHQAGAVTVRFRALRLPVDLAALEAALGAEGDREPDELGEELGDELVAGGESPLWDSLAPTLVLERSTAGDEAADAVVVVRFGQPQQGETARLLRGLYTGVSASVPAVWVDAGDEEEPRRPPGLPAVQDVRAPLGKVALVLLLANGGEGVFGTGEGADAVVPPIEPVVPEPAEGG